MPEAELVIRSGFQHCGYMAANPKDAAEYLRARGIGHVDAMYGVSMGGAAVIRFLATEDISVEKTIIDAGITPYPYPKWICRLLSVKDLITVILGTRSLKIMKQEYLRRIEDGTV